MSIPIQLRVKMIQDANATIDEITAYCTEHSLGDQLIQVAFDECNKRYFDPEEDKHYQKPSRAEMLLEMLSNSSVIEYEEEGRYGLECRGYDNFNVIWEPSDGSWTIEDALEGRRTNQVGFYIPSAVTIAVTHHPSRSCIGSPALHSRACTLQS